ncbi:MAG TPA: hydantoinase/oxoprolinase family protein [Actinomycetota bacterium]|nr:hydantoinase/oxoprolinase family protein [Actinomycetota bacterium]
MAVADGGELRVAKVPSTPSDPALALVEATEELLRAGVPAEGVRAVFHGTTVATNAVLTGGLARVTLVTTEGYRDVLSYRTGSRPALYDLEQPRPSELVPRRDRIEVRERLAWDGSVVTPLSPEEVARVVGEVRSRGPQAVAVCLLFSYVDDRHERALGRALSAALPGVPVSLSSEIAKEFREYPRTATTVVNAGLRPVVGRYLLEAAGSLERLGVRGPLLIMQSNGGSVPAERAEREAHRLLLSGPTAGVAGAIALGARHGTPRLISLDMGGTSLDVCLVRDGVPPVVPAHRVDVHPILAPSVDVVTVGAGGGSVVTVDASGRLRVGPRSAGADPGPACYGRGGQEATLTDAHVVAGTLGPETLLAGRLRLDPDAAARAVEGVAARLGLGLGETAEGIVAVATAHVVRALRRVSVERGIDPAAYSLVAFGGAGPLHAGRLLRELRIGAVVVPPHPGLFSAAGLVAADLRIDESRTLLRVLEEVVLGEVATWYREARARVVAQLRADGIPRERIRLVGSVECRYLGQGYELAVPLRGLDGRSLRRLSQDFHALHARTYGHHHPSEAVEVVTLRLSGFGALPRPEPPRVPRGRRDPSWEAGLGAREVLLPGERRGRRVPVFRRDLLRSGNRVVGPAIVEEMDSTTLVLPGQEAIVDGCGDLWLRETGR